MIDVFNRFRKKLTKEDNLLIYYAGHGQYDKETNTGYWQPIDAEEEADTQWIPNERITSILRGTRR